MALERSCMSLMPMLVSAAGGVGVGFFLRHMLPRYLRPITHLPGYDSAQSDEDDDEADFDSQGIEEEYRMMLIVRMDLKMGKGKIGAQCGHAALGAYKKALRMAPNNVKKWESIGQTKICVKVQTQEEMFDLMTNAGAAGLPTSIVRDAGRTQISPGTYTVLAIGPGRKGKIDKITSHLKLL